MDTGLNQYLDYGTSPTPTASCGRVTSGSMDSPSGLVHRPSIGSGDMIVGGQVTFTGNFDVILQSATLIAYALRGGTSVAPTLTALAFGGGVSGSARVQTGAYIDSLTLRCAVGEPLTAGIGWQALNDAVYSTVPFSLPAMSTKTYEWFYGTSTVEGRTVYVQGFEISLNNSITPWYDLDAGVAASLRKPVGLKIGNQKVTCRVDCLAGPSATAIADMIGDDLATNISCSCVLAGTNTITLGLSNLSRVSQPRPLVNADGTVQYTFSYEAPDNATCLSITAA